MLNNLSILKKMFFGFGIIFLFLALFSAVSILSVRRISQNSDFIKDTAFQRAEFLINIENIIKQMAQHITSSIDTGTGEEIKKAKALKLELDRQWSEVDRLFSNDENISHLLHELKDQIDHYVELGEQLVYMTINQEWTEIGKTINHFNKHQNDLLSLIAETKARGVDRLNNSLLEISSLTKQTGTTISIFMAMTFLSGISLAYVLGYQIVNPVGRLIDSMKVAESGDFTVRADALRKDEMGSLANGFNEMLAQIQKRDSELELHRDHLEQLVEQRTRELEHLNTQLTDELTERKRAEKALIESEEQLKTILDSIAVGIMVVDATSHQIADVNSFAAQTIGLSREQILNRTCHKFVCPAEKKKCPITDLGLKIDNAERMLLKADGTQIPIIKSVVPIMYKGREHLIESFIDISELKQAEQALRESEIRYRMLFENAKDAIFILEAEGENLGRIVDVNKAASDLHGYTAQELYDMSITDLNAPEAAQEAPERMQRMLDGEWISAEIMHRRKDGSLFPVEISSGLLPLPNHKYILAFDRDITERKRAEEDLKTFAEKLKKSNRELQDFAYVASHDLQEPLRKVTTFGDRLKDKFGAVLGDQGGDYIERMQNATRRMQTLIDDLLTYSRVTTKAQPFSPVNLGTIAAEVVSDLEVRIEQSGGHVQIGDLPTIDADPLQIRQLLQNLVGNALKFHRTGEPPTVKIHGEILNGTARKSSNTTAGLCRITVEDNGIGFDDKYADRIFAVFQRLHGRKEYEGTGVGLAVCRKIVERHGGMISAKSTPGAGATFTITLPVKQRDGNKNG